MDSGEEKQALGHLHSSPRNTPLPCFLRVTPPLRQPSLPALEGQGRKRKEVTTLPAGEQKLQLPILSGTASHCFALLDLTP